MRAINIAASELDKVLTPGLYSNPHHPMLRFPPDFRGCSPRFGHHLVCRYNRYQRTSASLVSLSIEGGSQNGLFDRSLIISI